MHIYSLMMLLIVSLNLLRKPGSKRWRRYYINISSIIMFVIMGFRDAFSIGNDSTTSYVLNWNSVNSLTYSQYFSSLNDEYNIGFRLFMKFCYSITGGDYQLFIIIISAIIMLSFRHLVKRYSVSPVQSFCCYWGLLYYTFMFSAEKQALAMAILVYAFDAAIDKKPIRFVLITLLAATFHFPALIFMPAYFVAQFEMNHGYLWVLGVSLTITYIFRNPLLQLMMKAYGNEADSLVLDNVEFFRSKVIIMIAIMLFALLFRPVTSKDRVYKTLLMFMCLAIVFQTFCGINNIFERLADYYFYYAVIFIPLVFEFPKKGKHNFSRYTELVIKAYGPLIFCSFAIIRFYLYLNGYPDNLLPYEFFF